LVLEITAARDPTYLFSVPWAAPPPTCNLGGVDLLANKSHVGEQLL
jgi:hypothetical protein